MKTVKLFFTFILILSCFVGAYFIYGYMNEPIIPPLPPNILVESREEIEANWEEAGDWDKDKFEYNCTLISLLKKRGYDVTPLHNYNTTLAVNIINDKIITEWKKVNCSDTVIKEYINAINVVSTNDENAKYSLSVENILNINSVYNDALKQAKVKVGLSTGFNPTNPSWNSFSNYSSKITKKTNEILNNGIYKEYLSNIKSIRDGLNAIPKKLRDARANFSNKLANEIVNYYAEIPDTVRNNEQLGKLRGTRDKYQSEFGENDDLNSFVSEFNRDVENNKEKEDESFVY